MLKKQYYYGFKGYFEIDNNGLIRAYVVTKASKTDTALVKTLLSEYRCIDILPMPKGRGFLDTNDTCLLK